ncbi:MAG: hypothetical protein JWR50_2898 [Mucilaginibacter sp.]|nr:hypothetical protein [Mucilaginibacter sp.]
MFINNCQIFLNSFNDKVKKILCRARPACRQAGLDGAIQA